MKRTLLFSLCITLCIGLISLVYAGTTGKIAGKVTDAATGEPLPGINIIVEGTSLGAATDLDGNYVINNIPPGKYNVIVSGVGYGKQRIEGVVVNVDFTTRLDLQMSTEAVEMETIVVQSKAPLVRKDLTSSQTTLGADQIEDLPVESVTQLLTLQAGIVQGSGGEIHIRGGRSNEITYTVNGVSISNPFNNSRTVTIATNAIQELSVVSGTFNAEYGNALSGIVNTVTKEGGTDYHGSFSFYTGDHISNRTDVFVNVDDVDPLRQMVMEGTLSGPIPFLGDKVTFFASGRYDDDKGWLYGIREQLPTDSIYRNPTNPNEIAISQNGDGSYVPMNSGFSWSTTGKLTFKPFTAVKINYDFLYSTGEYQSYSHFYKYNPDAAYNNFSWGMLHALEITHAINNETFYSVKGSWNVNDFKQYMYPLLNPDGSEADFNASMDAAQLWGGDPGDLHPDPRYQPSHKDNTVGSYTFSSGGTRNGHYYQRSNTYGLKFDITSQVTINHEVKSGFQFRDHTMEYVSFSVLRDTIRYLEPTIAGPNTPYLNDYVKTPVEFSAYVQDKMEFESIIVNAGVRYDYFDANSQYSTDIFNPSPYNPNLPPNVDSTALLADAPAKHMISPRFGISFPITDEGIIHFSYGHFYQMPSFSNLYTNPYFKYNYSSGSPTFGNADLDPQKTVTYEIGLQQQLMENLAFTVTAYYKDVRDLLALQQIRISGDETYFKYVNKDYANIKGIVFSLVHRKTPDGLFGATLDYTFETAEGNETNSDAFFLDVSSGRQTEKIPVLLGWDQTHTLNATISFGNPKDWNVTFVGRLGTGLPYTPQIADNNVFLRTNSGRKPSFARVDLLAEKEFSLYGLDLTLFLKVFNLFDTLNERLVYTDTGRATYTLLANEGNAKAIDELSKNTPGVHPVSDWFNNPGYYDAPREVRVGASIEF